MQVSSLKKLDKANNGNRKKEYAIVLQLDIFIVNRKPFKFGLGWNYENK